MRSDFLRVFVSLFLLFWAAFHSSAQPDSVRGTVFLDENGNGQREPSERPVPGVVVSNQQEVVRADANGAYELPASRDQIVFVSLPEGYLPVGTFWKRAGGSDESLDFPLRETARVTEFEFIHGSDPHVKEEFLDRIQKFRTLVTSVHPAFVLLTGDLVHDALAEPEAEAKKYFGMFLKETQNLPGLLFTVPGNHDIFGIERQVNPNHPLYAKKMYAHFCGPNYYSFNYGGIHFIGLDTVGINNVLLYYGNVDSKQLDWLRKDIAMTPKDQPVVTFNHIPIATTAEFFSDFLGRGPEHSRLNVNGKTIFRHVVLNADELLAELRKRPYPLALAGHTHMREALSLESNGNVTRFHQATAIQGPREIAGFKTSSGVMLYRVKNRVIDDGTFLPL